MDSKHFDARVSDMFTLAQRTCMPRFLGFLTESEQSQAIKILSSDNAKFKIWGGYEQAQRVMLACLPDWCDEPEYPISALTFRFRNCDSLTHRDFLGSLMALGITRESVGDILVEQGRAVLFISSDIADFVKSQLEKVGRVGVDIENGFSEPLPQQGVLTAFSDTVASMRLDCVVSALINSSRKSALELIEGGMVSICSVVCEKSARIVKSGENVTVRGKGKFFIDSADEFSKKGRIILKYSKYV